MSRFTSIILLFVGVAGMNVGCCLARRACRTCQPCHGPCGGPTCGPPACESCGACGPGPEACWPEACCPDRGPACGGSCHGPPCGGCGAGSRCGLLRGILRCLCDDCNGCGEVYWGPFHSDPPDYCDPCDDCGNWIGHAGPLQAPYGSPYSWDGPVDAGWAGADSFEEPMVVSERSGPRHDAPVARRRRPVRRR